MATKKIKEIWKCNFKEFTELLGDCDSTTKYSFVFSTNEELKYWVTFFTKIIPSCVNSEFKNSTCKQGSFSFEVHKTDEQREAYFSKSYNADNNYYTLSTKNTYYKAFAFTRLRLHVNNTTTFILSPNVNINDVVIKSAKEEYKRKLLNQDL